MNKERTKDITGLLHEVHERMYTMMEYCERLHMYYHDKDSNRMVEIHDHDESNEIYLKFQVNSDRLGEDQTGRSILKDLRKVIKYFEEYE